MRGSEKVDHFDLTIHRASSFERPLGLICRLIRHLDEVVPTPLEAIFEVCHSCQSSGFVEVSGLLTKSCEAGGS